MRVGEKIVLKNLGECNVRAEKNDTVFVSKDNVCYFVINPTKKRQEEEYSYDSVVCYGFTTNEVYDLIQPLYANIIDTLNKQYKLQDNISKIIIESLSAII